MENPLVEQFAWAVLYPDRPSPAKNRRRRAVGPLDPESNKVDLPPDATFDAGRCVEDALRVAPSLEVIRVSATRGDGLGRWYDGFRRLAAPRAPAPIRAN